MNQKVESINSVDMSNLSFPNIAVFYNPKDFPKQFVARVFDGGKPTNVVMVKDTLEEIVKDIRKNTSFVFIPRDSMDHPSVVGIWM